MGHVIFIDPHVTHRLQRGKKRGGAGSLHMKRRGRVVMEIGTFGYLAETTRTGWGGGRGRELRGVGWICVGCTATTPNGGGGKSTTNLPRLGHQPVGSFFFFSSSFENSFNTRAALLFLAPFALFCLLFPFYIKRYSFVWPPVS